MNVSLINAARAVAMSSEGVGKRNSYKVGAVIFNKNRIINAKHNGRKTHTYLSRFTDFPVMHAETRCILSTGFDNCAGNDLLCVRILANGELSCAKPCEICEQVIKESGLRRIYYSDWNGKIVRM